MDKQTRDGLSKAMVEYKKPGAGGRQFSYIKGEDVVGRLNSVFKNEWHSCVVDSFMMGEEVRQVIVLVELSAGGVRHQGYGGAEVAVYTGGHKQGLPVDISNSYKSAFTNGLKSCAKQFGIGLVTGETEPGEGPSAPTPPPKNSTVQHQAQAAVSTVTKDNKVEEISNLLAKSDLSPAKAVSLAQGFKDRDKPTHSEAAPFTPSVGDSNQVNDVQIGAMNAMSTMKKIEPKLAISQALGSGKKEEFKELTTEEARKVIKHLHSSQGA